MGPECDVIIASVVNVLWSDPDTRLIAGIKMLNDVDPVSIVMRVVTVTKVPISVFRIRICDPEKCRGGLGAWVRLNIG